MSRSGYGDGRDDEWSFIMWRGAVASAIRGKRGQAFLGELIAAMDALPEPRLIASAFQSEVSGEVCAIGSVGRLRNLDMSNLDPEDYCGVGSMFGIADAMAREIMYINDDYGVRTPEERFKEVRRWAERNIKR